MRTARSHLGRSSWAILLLAAALALLAGCADKRVETEGEPSAADAASATSTGGTPASTEVAATPTETPASPAPIREVEPSGECDGETSCEVKTTDNNLIMNVTGEWSATPEVAVEYWNDEVGRFRSQPVPVEDGAFEAPVVRLRPETDYEFRVLGLDEAGEDVPGPAGWFQTGSLPPGLQRATFDVLEGRPTTDLALMDFNPQAFDEEPEFHGMVAVDGDGQVVWYAETGEAGAIAQRENGNLVFVDYEFGLREITPLGEEVVSTPSECIPVVYHHEIELLPDGSVLTMGFDVRDTFDDPERLQVGDTVLRWDPSTGSVEEEWTIHDHADSVTNRTDSSGVTEGQMWKGCDEDLPTEDWSHGNAVKAMLDGGFLLSFRHLNQVYAVPSDFEGVTWRLGGEGSDFTFPDPSDQFYHQHYPTQLENGNVLLFDNGNTRPDAEGGEYSRALELELDTETMTARKVWEYVAAPSIFSPCCASAERLENGNTLMIFPGDVYTGDPCCRRQTIVEAGPAGETVWKLEAQARGLEVVYRVYPADSILGESAVTSEGS